MWFNIVMNNGTGGPPATYVNAAPLALYLRTMLSACGHDVTIVPTQAHAGAINLFFEGFNDPQEFRQRMQTYRREHGLRFGIVATELMIDNTIPYARDGITYQQDISAADRSAFLAHRVHAFESVMEEADFVWCWLERTAQWYQGRKTPVWFLPVGYAGGAPGPDLRRSPKDIEVLHFGKLTPHRISLLEGMQNAGLDVTAIGPGSSWGWVPEYMMQSLIDRSKIGLNLTLHSFAPEDRIDPRFASCMRMVEWLSRDVLVLSEEIPLDNPYHRYIASAPVDDLANMARHLLQSGLWRTLGPANGARFRAEMDVTRICKPLVDATLTHMELRKS